MRSAGVCLALSAFLGIFFDVTHRHPDFLFLHYASLFLLVLAAFFLYADRNSEAARKPVYIAPWRYMPQKPKEQQDQEKH